MVRVLIALFLSLVAPAVTAQEQTLTSPVLTIDSERLYLQSKFGQQMQTVLEDRSRALIEENREIESELVAEEKALTEERQNLDPEAFRARAKAFDEKVVNLRSAQDEKTRRLLADREALEQRFFQTVLPVLAQIIRERGAVVVLEDRSVFLAAGQIDITAEAISRIDAQFLQEDPQPKTAE
ncbi:OmpH family outer membrane protein [Actibacterium pelagium]|uniref:Outer membrane protein n=1 Tax=Actibacterium pelagium TaxID=2029103 RepID=A0A917ACB7_9RHOB|nr:OmpH family outer membrane protein [Actibacterium pelagium]GGE42298.1 outer membrane protein [Actibacterium pelagium]